MPRFAADRRRGFTLLELLVVISIIGLLVGLLLPQLAKARERARYIRWKGYSHGLRVNPEMSTYYNFEEQDGSETKKNNIDSVRLFSSGSPTVIQNLPSQVGVAYNRAAGDPFEQSKGRNTLRASKTTTVEPALRDMYLLPHVAGTTYSYSTYATQGYLPQWTQKFGRWPGKGAMMFGSVSAHIPAGFGVTSKGRACVAFAQDWDGVVGKSDRTLAFWTRSYSKENNVSGNAGGTACIADWGDSTSNSGSRFSVTTRPATVGSAQVAQPYVSLSPDSPGAVLDSRVDVRDGQWHWVVVTVNSEEGGTTSVIETRDLNFFVDGRDFGNDHSTDTTTIDTAVTTFTVGADLGGARTWNGIVDEVQLWRVALTVDKKDGSANGAQVTAGSIWDNWQAGAPDSRR